MKLDTAGKVHGSRRHGQLVLVASSDDLRRAVGLRDQQIDTRGRDIACSVLWFTRARSKGHRYLLDFAESPVSERPWDDEATAKLCQKFLDRQ